MALWRIALVSIKWIVREITKQISWVMSISLEDAVQNWLLSLTAYWWTEQNWTPTPTTPIDIVSNNGVIKFWEELFDINDCTDGYYYSWDWTYLTSSSWRLTDFIPVQAWETYVFKYTAVGTPNVRLNYFDINKTWLSQTITSSVGWTFSYNITPSQDWYIRISANRANAGSQSYINRDGVQILAQRIYVDWTTETINAHGKNLFDRDTVDQNFVSGKIKNNNGEEINDATSSYSTTYIKVSPSTSYAFSWIGGSAVIQRIYYYTKNKQWISRTQGTFGQSPAIFTTPDNCEYIQVQRQNAVYIAATNIQLELGSTATDYAPYYNGGTATAEMLLKVGDYQDEQEILAWNITRKVGIKVLDWTEDWSRSDVRTKLVLTDSAIGSGDWNLYCTHYQGFLGSASIGNMPDNSCKINVNTNELLIKDATHNTDLATWRQFLADQYAAGTPVIVVYPLAEETTETVAGQTMNIQAWSNTIEITQASLDDLELSAEYKALPSN